ncbi:histone deacetylase 9-like isoform X1 [Orbicella faveolata]|uniref:histone deacetylase 9-like isoform X1 n=1 Tax=Orbicella faveolata TaxID=48498 RepID=UPI0009E1E324|nr:histone deacetylase 9-like isoform X1 [Orbicella faveolata]
MQPHEHMLNIDYCYCPFLSDMNNHYAASVSPEGVAMPRFILSPSQQQQLADIFHLKQQQEMQQQLLYQNFQHQLQALQQQQQHELQYHLDFQRPGVLEQRNKFLRKRQEEQRQREQQEKTQKEREYRFPQPKIKVSLGFFSYECDNFFYC